MARIAAPEHIGNVSLEEALARRRSVRSFAQKTLSVKQVERLFWAAQGITDLSRRLRTAPSAGAIYPLELYAVTADSVSRYLPENNSFDALKNGDLRPLLAAAAFGQDFVAFAPLTIVIAADYGKIEAHYGERARRYTDMEAGHTAQNIHLQATALGLGSVPVGAFNETDVHSLLGLPENLLPIYLVPTGYPK
jgi:SagB-type dehydrogenase family enzyme